MSTELPLGFTKRAPKQEDASIISEMIIACDIADYGEADFTTEDLLTDWRRAGFELARDAWLVSAPNGTPAAYGQAWDSGTHVRVDPLTCVHPQFREQGLEDFLADTAEDWTRCHSENCQLQWIVNSTHTCWTRRFEERGYHTTRHDYVMEIELNQAPSAPKLADGFVMRSFVRGQDERSAWACLQEAFRDHRGHTDLAFEEWGPRFFQHAHWSPELSTLITQGDELVGAAMVFNYDNGGWIRQLGVRRDWRKRGLGQAMLDRVFGECFARGIKKVGLGVDAENLTGATRLYERAGMHVKEHFLRYEKKIEQIRS